MKFIYFVFLVFSVGLGQVYSANSSARRSQVRNREYYASVPVVIVYDDSSKKEAVTSTEGKLAMIQSTTEATLGTIDQINKIETVSEKVLLPDVPIVPRDINKKQRSSRRNAYEIPVAVVYDSATEAHIRQKLEAVTDTDIPVTARNIRQRGRKRYRDQQDTAGQKLDKEVKLTARVLKEATISLIETNSLPKETVKTKTIVRRRRPSKDGLKVVDTTQNTVVLNEPTVIENISNVSENFKPVIKENVKLNSVIEVTTSSIDESLQDEQVLFSSHKNNLEKPVKVQQRTKSREPVNPTVNSQNFWYPSKPVIEDTTPSIDESLQDEQITTFSPKNKIIILKEKTDTVQRRTRTRGPVTSVVKQNMWHPAKVDTEITTPSMDELSMSSQNVALLPSPRNDAITQINKPDKNQRRTRIRGPVVPIVNSRNFVYQNGEFHYSFEGGDGTKKFENGVLKPFDDDVTGEAVEGGFSYKDKDGKSFSLTYTADENGYRPIGAHLPTPPPIPPAIARALQYLATKPTPAEYDDVTEKLKL